MNLTIRSVKKTRPIAFAGKPKENAISVVTIEAIILQDTAFAKLLDLLSIYISMNLDNQ